MRPCKGDTQTFCYGCCGNAHTNLQQRWRCNTFWSSLMMKMMLTTNTGAMVDVWLAGLNRDVWRRDAASSNTSWHPERNLSVSDEVYKCHREGSSSHWIAFDVAQPPLLVLLSIHHDHLALREGQLVWVVGYTVVDGSHSLRPLFWVGLPRRRGWRQRLTYGVLGASWHFLSWSFDRYCSIQRSVEAFIIACRRFRWYPSGPQWSLTRLGLYAHGLHLCHRRTQTSSWSESHGGDRRVHVGGVWGWPLSANQV